MTIFCHRCGRFKTPNEMRGDLCRPCSFAARCELVVIVGLLIFFFACLFGGTSCQGSVVTAANIAALVQSESGGNPRAKGKAGEIGLLQLKAIAVKDVNRIYGTRFSSREMFDGAKCLRAGELFLRLQESRLKAHLRRDPTWEEVRGAFRYGFAGYKRRNGL